MKKTKLRIGHETIPVFPKGTFGKRTPGYMELLKENDEINPSTPEARRSGRCGNGGEKSIVQYPGNDFSSLPFQPWRGAIGLVAAKQ
ncbi:hypothetical protein DID88_000540 [Monilinia fructigena]|uniref:Uncharacterized protein n=1 Tax=Monilinia fructigena TaxID=38457 RepID=A0A395IKL3_9HELO|nr:hypothetical protein DID88_000540 [Monilinia fructigena]